LIEGFLHTLGANLARTILSESIIIVQIGFVPEQAPLVPSLAVSQELNLYSWVVSPLIEIRGIAVRVTFDPFKNLVSLLDTPPTDPEPSFSTVKV
jgi:hypothetical protein